MGVCAGIWARGRENNRAIQTALYAAQVEPDAKGWVAEVDQGAFYLYCDCQSSDMLHCEELFTELVDLFALKLERARIASRFGAADTATA
jgi:hypothetical protein